MLQGDSECQNLKFPLWINPLKVIGRIFICCIIGTNGLIVSFFYYVETGPKPKKSSPSREKPFDVAKEKLKIRNFLKNEIKTQATQHIET